MSNCVVNLSPEKGRVFAEIARVLRPGGRFTISDIVLKGALPDALAADPELRSGCVGGAIGEAEYVAGLRAAGLEEVVVEDRLVYSAAQLEGLLEEMTADGQGCGCGSFDRATAKGLAARLAGQVWSARITGRKPDGGAIATRGARHVWVRLEPDATTSAGALRWVGPAKRRERLRRPRCAFRAAACRKPPRPAGA